MILFEHNLWILPVISLVEKLQKKREVYLFFLLPPNKSLELIGNLFDLLQKQQNIPYTKFYPIINLYIIAI